jgi:hypothetical protein
LPLGVVAEPLVQGHRPIQSLKNGIRPLDDKYFAVEVVVLIEIHERLTAEAASREPTDRAHEAIEKSLWREPVPRNAAVGVGRHR